MDKCFSTEVTNLVFPVSKSKITAQKMKTIFSVQRSRS
jgi:hypothetical protein